METTSITKTLRKQRKKIWTENSPIQRQEKQDVLETGQDHYIFHNQQKYIDFYRLPDCKSNCSIYLMKCILCKLQSLGKSETPFNLRLNNLRSDVLDRNASLHFVMLSKENTDLKSHSHLPKKFLLFASMITLQKWWAMAFISS